ncbi:helix-turn-helix domain-containing protein [Negadavirga shengliensis]|uniref:Helix-turn-helix domain-containing protein n=1 Tax=Negadavirga shengliensis TaxID=1389218 RepID=A0ABV9T211_9BACT
MKLNLDIFSLLVLLGACQGLVFSLFLFFSKQENLRGKNYLGFFMLILAYNGFETLSWSSGINDPYIDLFFNCFHFMLIFGLGPSLYLYIKSIVHQNKIPSTDVRIYFLPLIIRVVMRISLIIYALLWGEGTGWLSPMDLDGWDVIIAEPLSVLVFCFYLGLTFRELHLHCPVLNRNREEINAKWLKLFLKGCAVFCVTWVVTVLSPMVFDIEYGPHFYAIEILLVFFIYWIALASYYRTKVIYVNFQKPASSYLNNLSSEDMLLYTNRIEHAMKKDKLYLDATLNVKKLAEHTQITPKMISAVLNGHLKQSFNEFVNTYRIEEVKRRLLEPQNGHLTISGIAFESGFNSQATFQRSFKNHTGMSPKAYIASRAQISV